MDIAKAVNTSPVGGITFAYFISLMPGSSHIRCVLSGIQYRNCCQTFDVYLCFANSIKIA